ncbi:MAG: tetratricopeptide repeat protein [Deltaproteobacteria bacterium]|nr:tetratricopeptide repeat protein [Deltaproteobacteria bacterium]
MSHSALVADADGTSLELLAAVLTRNGFAVTSTNDGGDAISRFFAAPCRLVLCASDIAGFSAERVCREIRQHDPSTHIVLVCGPELSELDRLDLAARLGCDAVMVRPFRFAELRERLGEWGLTSTERARGAPAAVALDFGVPSPPPLQLALPQPPPPPAAADLMPEGVTSAPGPALASAALPLPVGVPDLPEIPLEDVVTETVPKTPPAVATPPATDDDIDLSELASVAPAAAPPPPSPPPSAPPPPPPAPQALAWPSVPVAARTPTPSPLPPAPAPAPAPAVSERPAPSVVRPTPLPPSVPRQGDLASMPLPRLLFELYIATYSGIVRLSRKSAERAIYIWGGFPVRVDAEQLAESLGVLLRDEGRITEEQYAAAQELVLERNIKLGEALVEVAALRESELLDALREQTERKLVATFAWRDGSYQIVDDLRFANKAVLSEIHPLKAIWRGVRETYDLMGLMTFFAKLRTRYIEATDLFTIHFDSLGPFLRELDLLPLLNGHTTFEAALRADDARGLELAQALYVLLVTDMIRPTAKPGRAAAPLRAVATAAPGGAAVDYRDLMAAAERIAKEYLRVTGASYFAALEVEEYAGADVVEAGFQRVTLRLTADAGIAASSPDVVKRARQIADTLAEARRVLTDPALRTHYLQTLFEREPEIPLDTEVGAGATTAADSARRETLINAEQAFRDGTRLLEAGDADGARAHLRRAVELNPSEPTYHAGLAQVAIALAAPDADTTVLAHLEAALRLDPANLVANLEAAKLFCRQGHLPQAKSHLDRILQRAPHHQLARRLLAEITAKLQGAPTP